MNIVLSFIGAVWVVFSGYLVATSGWHLPPANSTQTGFRGTGMVQIHDQNAVDALAAKNQAPAPISTADAGGPRARTLYPTLQVLGDLSEDQFNRLMASFSEWVAPKEGDNAGCTYCHNVNNMADRSLYTHTVATRMITMTRTVNSEWRAHVADIGVTCYTCHRGQPVPPNIWFRDAKADPPGWLGWTNGQNRVTDANGLTTLPADFQSAFLASVRDSRRIRVTGASMAAGGDQRASIEDTEWTHALMNHMSNGLGVNCTFCHNSRAFNAWDQSPPQRAVAWHGIRMVRELNQTYLEPLGPTYPATRRGPSGDAPKANCATCHNGQPEPLNGARMLQDYLAELGGPRR